MDPYLAVEGHGLVNLFNMMVCMPQDCSISPGVRVSQTIKTSPGEPAKNRFLARGDSPELAASKAAHTAITDPIAMLLVENSCLTLSLFADVLL